MVVKFPCAVRGAVDLETIGKNEQDYFKVTADKDFSVLVEGTKLSNGKQTIDSLLVKGQVMKCDQGKCKTVKPAGRCKHGKKGKTCYRKGTYYIRVYPENLRVSKVKIANKIATALMGTDNLDYNLKIQPDELVNVEAWKQLKKDWKEKAKEAAKKRAQEKKELKEARRKKEEETAKYKEQVRAKQN
jgi:hypothetical protein